MARLTRLTRLAFGCALPRDSPMARLTRLTRLAFGCALPRDSPMARLTRLTRLAFGCALPRGSPMARLTCATRLAFGCALRRELAAGDLEHAAVDAERALADALEHPVHGGWHEGGGAQVAEGALGREVLVGAPAAHHLDDLGGDREADLGGDVLGLVAQHAALLHVGRLPALRAVGQHEPRGVQVRGELADVSLHRGVVGHRDVLRLHDPLLGVVDREG